VKTAVTAKKPFGKAKYCPVKHARYLDWEDAFDVEFDGGLCFLEPQSTIKKANKISGIAAPKRVSVPKKLRTHFKIEYDTGEVAEVSWSFIREFPPKRTGNCASLSNTTPKRSLSLKNRRRVTRHFFACARERTSRKS
jgi:hypothetical protein